jgi:GT2 family glycosyltransferase
MLVPRNIVEQLGAFDPDLFFLYEDVDWSLRMRAAGLRIWFEPRARVWHRVAASQGGRELTPTTLYYGTRNHLAVCDRHAPRGRFQALRRDLVILAVHVAQTRSAEQRCAALRGAWNGWRDGRAGSLGPRRNSSITRWSRAVPGSG